MFGSNEPEPRITVARSRDFLINRAGVNRYDLEALLHNARREGVIIYTEDKSLTDETPVYILDRQGKWGGYRTTCIISMIQYLDGA